MIRLRIFNPCVRWGITPNNIKYIKMSEVPRRNRLDLFVPAEKAIFDAMQEVEKMDADVRLTHAVILLQKAQEKVADFVDNK